MTERVDCPYRTGADLPRRPANALNIEVGAPLPRCVLKTPEHWGDSAPSARRWLLSGGSPFVFGPCSTDCPKPASPRREFWATYEIVRRGEAIVELTLNGEWYGGGLVSIRSGDPAALYEAAYAVACASARSHDGILGRFSRIEDAQRQRTLFDREKGSAA